MRNKLFSGYLSDKWWITVGKTRHVSRHNTFCGVGNFLLKIPSVSRRRAAKTPKICSAGILPQISHKTLRTLLGPQFKMKFESRQEFAPRKDGAFIKFGERIEEAQQKGIPYFRELEHWDCREGAHRCEEPQLFSSIPYRKCAGRITQRPAR